MKDHYERKRHSISQEDHGKMINLLKEILEKNENVLFAYLHGSFTEGSNFGDIDIAAYLKQVSDNRLDVIDYEFKMEKTLEEKISYPVDVRVLNGAPPSFRYSVIKNGIKLVEKDEDKRVDFETMAIKIYFDFLPFRKRYFREAIKGEV